MLFSSAKTKLSPPSLGVVIFGLVVTYVGVCGLASLWYGTLALLLSVLLGLLQVAVAGFTFDLRHPSTPYYFVLWVLTITVAASVGSFNYHSNYSPYRTATSGRVYSNVGPDAMAAVLMDAGVVVFQDHMMLDDAMSVGLRLFGTTYCVAPVIGQVARVQFWAIGTDCCESRGGFACGDAQISSARTGLVSLGPQAEQQASPLWRRYMQAIQAACALHGLETPTSPLLLTWVDQPSSVLTGMYTRSLLVWILSSIAYGVVASIICFSADYYFTVGGRGAIGFGGLAAGFRPEHYQPYDPQLKAQQPP